MTTLTETPKYPTISMLPPVSFDDSASDSNSDSDSDLLPLLQPSKWEELKVDCAYEIYTKHPYPIKPKRRIRKGRRFVTESPDPEGYLHLSLTGVNWTKHRVVAEQWIPNPKKLPIVDHIDGDPSNNHVDNLRWVTHSENGLNRHTCRDGDCESLADIPDEAIVVRQYSKWKFENLYYLDSEFYFFDGLKYRKLVVYEHKSGLMSVGAKDIDGKHHLIYYSKFKREYRLP